MLPRGAQLGSYTVIAPLRAGGTSEGYRARDSRLKREVALKLLLPALSADPAAPALLSPDRRVRAVAEAVGWPVLPWA